MKLRGKSKVRRKKKQIKESVIKKKLQCTIYKDSIWYNKDSLKCKKKLQVWLKY